MSIVPAAGDPPPADAIALAARMLAAGEVVGVPTDTVYGLAADPRQTCATAALFATKGRPGSVELPVLVADEGQALDLAGPVPGVARRLMAHFWPGPLTVVLARRPGLDLHLGGDAQTIGVRCPGHVIPLTLCRTCGPMATTSANLHGRPPATTADEVAHLAGVAMVLDAGPCPTLPSTVVACLSEVPTLLREGAVSWSAISAAAAP